MYINYKNTFYKNTCYDDNESPNNGRARGYLNGTKYSLCPFEKLGIQREGFSRKLFAVSPIAQGQLGRVKVRRKDVVAYQVTTDVKVQENRIRQTWIYPPEFYLVALILIEDKEIAQASSDLLDEKFQDGLEAILRREDLITRALLVRGATSFNDLVLFTNFTPAVLSTMRTQVNRWGTPAATLTIAWDLWDDIIADSDFVQWYINLPPNAVMC